MEMATIHLINFPAEKQGVASVECEDHSSEECDHRGHGEGTQGVGEDEIEAISHAPAGEQIGRFSIVLQSRTRP